MTFTHLSYLALSDSKEGYTKIHSFPSYGHDCFEVVYFCKPFELDLKPDATLYGFSMSKDITIGDPFRRTIPIYHAFSLPIHGRRFSNKESTTVEGNGLCIIKHGYIGQDTNTRFEDKGRLSYIDGCTDSVLVYPPRKGDPCLNSLHFPAGIEQTMHTHPTSRVGLIVGGFGVADLGYKTVDLKLGDAFIIPANCKHRFKTKESYMNVVAWHPDSDWGPEDHNHPMLNRTFLK